MESTLAGVVTTALFACTPRSDSPQSVSGGTKVGFFERAGADTVTTTVVDARPAALVNGRVVEWGEMRPLLNEAAGAMILQEVMLDRLITAELLKTGLTVTSDDVDRERKLFYEILDLDPDVAIRLGRRLRARQGLGDKRFDRLLRRNAGLRALVGSRIEVTGEAVGLMYEIIYGVKRQARLMVLPTLAQAQQAIDRINDGETFTDVAVEVSTDISAARGGLLSPISDADPTYPRVLRDTLLELSAGQISAPILLGDQYAVLQMVREQEGHDLTLAEARPDMERRVRLSQERILMDQLARRLMAEVKVTIIDEALQQSWEFRNRATGGTR